MGLLDEGLDNPITRFGLGLLAASGSNANLGQNLASAVGSLDQWKQQKAKDAFMKMQMDNYASEIEQRKAAIAKQAKLQEMIESALGGGSGSGHTQAPKDVGMGGGSGLSIAGVGGNAGGASPIPTQSGGLANMSPDQLARLKIAGVDLTDVYKLTRPNLTNVNGTLVDSTDPRNADRFVPNPKDGFGFNPKTSEVSLLPGFLKAQTDLTTATEVAKAGQDLIDVPDGKGGLVKMPRDEAVKILSSSLKNTQPKQTGYAGGSVESASSGQLDVLNAELAKEKDPSNRAAIQREIARITGKNPQLGVTISDAEKERQKVLAVGDANRENENIGKSNQFKDFGNQINVARTLLQAGPTGSWFGSKVDDVAGVFGVSPSSANLAKKLETTAGWMIQNIPKAPGAQSEAELRDYKVAAGIVGDKTVPVEQRLAALDTVEQLKNLWESRANGTKSDSKPNLLSDLPKTAAVGARVRDTVTGQVMRFDGLKWKPE